MNGNNISLWLDRQSAANPSRRALIHNGRVYDFAWLSRAVAHTAAELAQQGLAAGRIAALLIHDRRQLLLTQIAFARLGATLVNLNGFDSAHGHAQLLSRTRADFLVSDRLPEAEAALQEAMAGRCRIIPLMQPVESRGDSAGLDRFASVPVASSPQDPWVLLIGSGSTGDRKILPVSQSKAIARAHLYAQSHGYQAGDCLLCLTPLELGFGMIRTVLTLCQGVPVLLLNPGQAIDGEALRQQAVTILVGGSRHAEQFLSMPPHDGQRKLDFLRVFLLGGSTVNDNLRRRIIAGLTPNLYVNYGCQECGPLTVARPMDLDVPGGVGRPLEGVELRIVDDSGRELPAGQTGRIQIRSQSLIKDYLADPGATQLAFRDGWFSPGDIGELDANGHLIYRGRADHMMICDGVNIYPSEVEDAMSRCPGVTDVACVPMPSPVYQDIPVCVFCAPPDVRLSGDQLRRFAFDRLGARRPRVFVRLSSIPRTATGKLIRKELHRRLEDLMPGARFHDARSDLLPVSPSLAGELSRLPASAAALSSDGIAALPVCYAQRSLWSLYQHESGRRFCHGLILWSLTGRPDVEALEQALSALVARHSSLRTAFHQHGHELLQTIHPPVPVLLSVSLLAEGSCPVQIDRWLQAEAATPFDLRSGLLLRARLLSLGSQKHLLLIIHHKIAADVGSRAVLEADLAELVNAGSLRRPARLPPLTVPSHHFCIRQHQALRGDRLQALLDYWIPELTGLEPLALPMDGSRSASAPSTTASIGFQVDAALLAPFEDLCRGEDTILPIGFLALIALLLQRYTRQDDLAIGLSVLGHPHADLQPAIGCFTNLLPIRIRLSPERSFRQLLREIRITATRAAKHRALPIELMVDALQLEQDPGRHPLVQVVLEVHEQASPPSLACNGLHIEPLVSAGELSQFDLSVSLRQPTDHGLSVSITYATDRFAADRMQRLRSHLLTLLASAVQAPDAPSRALRLLPHAEQLLIASWQDGTSQDVVDLCVHHLFEQTVDRLPEATALVFDQSNLSYQQLNAQVNQLAHQLIHEGVRPGTIVGVCLDRSVELIVSLLAILKVGGAFLSLPTNQPHHRLGSMLTAAGCGWVVTATEPSLDPPEVLPAGLRRISLAALNITAQPVANPRLPISPSECAYVLFTSGTTGVPKPVVVAHRALANRCQVYAQVWRLDADSRVLAHSEFWTDNALREWLLPLTCGATVVLASSRQQQDPDLLLSVLRGEHCTHLAATPSRLSTLISDRHRLGPITVTAGGERLAPSLASGLRAASPARLMQSYGSTETCLACAFHDLPAIPGPDPGPAGEAPIPLGRPLPNTTLKILDPCGQPCPIGIPGELYVGGPGLASGYLHDPQLTASRFLSDVCSHDSNARLYQSGDLAAWNADGTLSWHGRVDHQIKWRGFRIEPSDIEAHLLAHPAVARSAILLRQDDPDNPRLVAYWCPRQPRPGFADQAIPAVAPEQLRLFLAQRLPATMLPSDFIALPDLPLTASGKPDRRALSAPRFAPQVLIGPEVSRAVSVREEPPSSWLENRLLAAWRVILNRPDLDSVDAHFFQLGGNSIQAVRLRNFIHDIVGASFHIGQLFATPTVRSLAAALAERAACDGSDVAFRQLVCMQPVGSKPPLLICHGLYGDTFETRFIAAAMRAFSRPVYGLQDLHRRAGVKPSADGSGLAELADRYASEIADLCPDGPIHLAGFCLGAWVAHATAISLEAMGRHDVSLFMFEPSLANHPEAVSIPASQFRDLQVGLRNGASSFTYQLPKLAPKSFHIDPTHQRVRAYKPGIAGARLTVAMAGGSATPRQRLHFAALVSGCSCHPVRFELISELRTHLDFRDRAMAAPLAKRIERSLARFEVLAMPDSSAKQPRRGFSVS